MACEFGSDGVSGDDGDASEAGLGDALDGSWADRREIEAQILAALGRLDQHATPGFGADTALAAQPGDAREKPVGALDVFHHNHMAVDHDDSLADIEGPERAQHLPPPCDVGGGRRIRRCAGDASLRHQEIGRDILDANHAKAVLLENAADPRQQMIVAAAKRRHDAAEDAERSPVQPDLRQRRPHQRADEDQVAATLAAKQFRRAAELADRNPVMAKALDPHRIAGALSANRTGAMPRAASESATANGMAPPPAITPTGEEISEAADIMAAAIPSSLLVAVVGRKAQRAVLAVANEGEDFGDRRILATIGCTVFSRSAKMPGP